MMRYNDDRFISHVLEEDNVGIVQNNLDYLRALYQLTSLNYFVSGNTSGALRVLVMNLIIRIHGIREGMVLITKM